MSETGPRDIPPEERMSIPEGLDEDTIMFVLEMLGSIAMDYGLEAMQMPEMKPHNPESVVDFAAQLRERIEQSEKSASEKEAVLQLLDRIVNQLRTVLQYIQRN
jgi:hypothetical protein